MDKVVEKNKLRKITNSLQQDADDHVDQHMQVAPPAKVVITYPGKCIGDTPLPGLVVGPALGFHGLQVLDINEDVAVLVGRAFDEKNQQHVELAEVFHVTFATLVGEIFSNVLANGQGLLSLLPGARIDAINDHALNKLYWYCPYPSMQT